MSAVAAAHPPLPRGRLRRVTVPTAARTVVVGTWLVVLAVAGSPGWPAVLVGLGLVAVWTAPLLAGHGRTGGRPRPDPAGPPPPGGAPAT